MAAEMAAVFDATSVRQLSEFHWFHGPRPLSIASSSDIREIPPSLTQTADVLRFGCT
jgi:hypothetical protein